MAIKSVFLFTPWREMKSLSPALLYNPDIFIIFFCLYCQLFQRFNIIFVILYACTFHLYTLTDKDSGTEIFPASTPSLVVSKEKIPWTRSTWRNHSLLQTPQRELSGCCCIPGQRSGTKAHWGCGTAHRRSVESRSSLLLVPATHTDCKKARPVQRVQSQRKAIANRTGKHHRNAIHVEEIMHDRADDLGLQCNMNHNLFLIIGSIPSFPSISIFAYSYCLYCYFHLLKSECMIFKDQN